MAVFSLKCPNCDGELLYDAARGDYKCSYCFSTFSQEEVDAIRDASSIKSDDEKPQSAPQPDESRNGDRHAKEAEEDAAIYICPSCGAEIVTDATTAATFCYYCHTPVTLSGRVSGALLPDSIIPFSVEKEEAVSLFLDNGKRKRFCPSDFFEKKNIEKVTGVYFPYWVYDTSFYADYEGTATRYEGNGAAATEAEVYEVVRRGNVDVGGYVSSALKKANKDLVEGVEPFRYEEAKPFSMGYLSGFFAERRDVEKEEIERDVYADTEQVASQIVQNSITGEFHPRKSTLDRKSSKWSYMLLPVWSLTYKGDDGEIYYYAMNGQTKKLYGRFPLDQGKLLRYTLLASFSVGVLIFLFMLWMMAFFFAGDFSAATSLVLSLMVAIGLGGFVGSSIAKSVNNSYAGKREGGIGGHFAGSYQDAFAMDVCEDHLIRGGENLHVDAARMATMEHMAHGGPFGGPRGGGPHGGGPYSGPRGGGPHGGGPGR